MGSLALWLCDKNRTLLRIPSFLSDGKMKNRPDFVLFAHTLIICTTFALLMRRTMSVIARSTRTTPHRAVCERSKSAPSSHPSSLPPSGRRSLQISKSCLAPSEVLFLSSLPPPSTPALRWLPCSLARLLPRCCVFPLSLILKRFSPSFLNDYTSLALHCSVHCGRTDGPSPDCGPVVGRNDRPPYRPTDRPTAFLVVESVRVICKAECLPPPPPPPPPPPCDILSMCLRASRFLNF